MKRKINFFIEISVLFSFFLPIFALAQGQINPPPSSAKGIISGLTYECDHTQAGECTWDDLLAATKNVLDKGTIFALEFSVIVIAYAGFKYMTSEGNPGKIKEANTMFYKVAIGIVVILAAWLIVTLILGALGTDTIVKFG
jgi:hypothetical protein